MQGISHCIVPGKATALMCRHCQLYIFKNTVCLKPIGNGCDEVSFKFSLDYAAINKGLIIRVIFDNTIYARLTNLKLTYV